MIEKTKCFNIIVYLFKSFELISSKADKKYEYFLVCALKTKAYNCIYISC